MPRGDNIVAGRPARTPTRHVPVNVPLHFGGHRTGIGACAGHEARSQRHAVEGHRNCSRNQRVRVHRGRRSRVKGRHLHRVPVERDHSSQDSTGGFGRTLQQETHASVDAKRAAMRCSSTDTAQTTYVTYTGSKGGITRTHARGRMRRRARHQRHHRRHQGPPRPLQLGQRRRCGTGRRPLGLQE